jgi:hypothetical protein
VNFSITLISCLLTNQVLLEIAKLSQSQVDPLLARAEAAVRATIAEQQAALERQVKDTSRRIKPIVAREVSTSVENHVPRKVANVLQQDATMKAILQEHIHDVDTAVSEATRAVLRRIVAEDRYQTINAALLQSLRSKVEADLARAEQVSGLKVQQLDQIYNTDYSRVPFCTWIPTTSNGAPTWQAFNGTASYAQCSRLGQQQGQLGSSLGSSDRSSSLGSSLGSSDRSSSLGLLTGLLRPQLGCHIRAHGSPA